MSILQHALSTPQIREIERVVVRVEPATAWSHVREMDAFRVPLVRLLFALREVPDQLGGWLRGRHHKNPGSARIDDLVAPGAGWVLLGEEPGREVVLGCVGKLWQSSAELVQVTPEQFRQHAPAGVAKLAVAIVVAPGEAGSFISIELRLAATDSESRQQLERFWRRIHPALRAAHRGVTARLARELGTPPPDSEIGLPGDELVPMAHFQRTHSRTIEAPPSDVWPWLVQMGSHRAGWYSFDRVDNAGVPSAERIIEALQRLEVGDIIATPPKPLDGLAVLRVEPERLLVLGSPTLLSGVAAHQHTAASWQVSWAFVLVPIGGDATRLIVRVRADAQPSARSVLTRPLLGLAHEIMEREQLRNLARRAESRVDA